MPLTSLRTSRRLLFTALLAALTLAAASAQAAYIKVSNSGAFLPDTAALGADPDHWACTYDDVKHLLWEVKTSDGGLRDGDKTYTNYDDVNQPQVWNGDTPATFRNPTDAEIAAASNSIGFVNAVNALNNHTGLCGFKDWRMPTGGGGELNGLVVTGQTPAVPSIDRTYFPNTPAWIFWSGSPVAGFPDVAWGVDFNYGLDSSYYRFDALAVRLVRGGQLLDLLIETSGSGAGAVTDATAALNCTRSAAGATSGACSSPPRTQPSYTLTAAPAAGSSFAGWSGCDSQTTDTPPQCVVSASAAKTVTATFNGPAVGTVAAVPTLGEWPLLLLGLAAAGLGARRLRQKF